MLRPAFSGERTRFGPIDVVTRDPLFVGTFLAMRSRLLALVLSAGVLAGVAAVPVCG